MKTNKRFRRANQAVAGTVASLVASLVASTCVLLTSCAFDRSGVPPKLDDFYYPMGVVAHPQGRYAYVSNSDFDLRYNAGHIAVVDLDAVKPLDALDSADPYNRSAIRKDSGVKILPFAGLPTFSSDSSRLFLPVREENTLFALDVAADGSSLGCLSAGNKPYRSYLSCDAAHSFVLSGKLFSSALDDTATVDPFAMAVVPPRPGLPTEYLFVAHLSSGSVSAYDITKNAVTNPNGFAAAGLVGFQSNGTGSVAVATGVGRNAQMYVGSRTLATVNPPSTSALFSFDPIAALQSPTTTIGILELANSVGGQDVKFLIASPNGDRVYMLITQPNALVAIDTSVRTDGTPTNRLLDNVPLGRLPSTMTYLSKPEGDLIYVTSLSEDQVSIFDAKSLAQVGSIDLYPFAACGSDRFDQCTAGPYGLAVANTANGPKVLVTLFNNDALLVIDAAPASPAQHKVVARVGSPRSKK